MIDCFAGVGGNTIHFALSGRWECVYGIEKDAEVLACARHNAEIYGVADQIEWIEGDCFDVLKDVVGLDGGDGTRVVLFGSPPWGGGFTSFSFFLLKIRARFVAQRREREPKLVYLWLGGDWIHRTGISFRYRVRPIEDATVQSE